MKTLIKLTTRLFVILLFVSLTNCEKDETETTHLNRENPNRYSYNVTSLSKSEVLENKIISREIENIKQQLSKFKSNEFNRTIYSSDYDFTINTDHVTYIENSDATYHSFTFPIVRSIPNQFVENLLISLQQDGSYRAFIVSYNLTNNQQYDLNNNMQIDLSDKAVFTEINATNLTNNIFNRIPPCGYSFEWVCWEEACQIDGCWDPQYTTSECNNILAYNDCDLDFGGGSSSGNSSSNPSGGTTSNTHTSNVNNNNNNNTSTNVTIPNIPTFAEQIENCINGLIMVGDTSSLVIEPGTIDALNLNREEISNLYNYLLTENNCDQDAKDFILEVVDVLEDDGEVDFEDTILVDSSFVNNTKANCVYNRLKSLSPTFFNSILDDFDQNQVSRLKLRVDDIPQNSSTINFKAKTLPRYPNGGSRNFDIILDTQFVENASLMEIALVLIHETIHAEIMERCIQLGIITGLNFTSNWDITLSFSNGIVETNNTSDALFATLMNQYSMYGGPPGNINWQHNIFNSVGYRQRISEDLEQIHTLIDDSNNPFSNNLNNGIIIEMTMEEYFDLLPWYGLEFTDEFNTLSDLDLTKISQAINQTELYYNENCN